MARNPVPAGGSTPRRERRQKIIAATLVPLVLLLALEGLARLIEPRADLVEVSTVPGAQLPSWFLADPALRETLRHMDRVPAHIDTSAVFRFWQFYQRDLDLHYRLKPNLDTMTVNTLSPPELVEKMRWRLTSNASGFRGEMLPAAPLPIGQKLVVCLGDSSTYGWGVAETEPYPARLAAQLAMDEPGWTVINLGHPGFTSWQGRLLAERIAALRPEIVTISFGTNDAADAGLSDAELHRRDHSFPARVARAAEHLAMFRVLQRATLAVTPAKAGEGAGLVPRVPVPEYEQNLRAIVDTVRRAGGRAYFVLVGHPRGYAQAVAGVATETGTPLLPTDQLFDALLPEVLAGGEWQAPVDEVRQKLGGFLEKNPAYYLLVDSTHPNAIGHELIARRLATLILGRAPRRRGPDRVGAG